MNSSSSQTHFERGSGSDKPVVRSEASTPAYDWFTEGFDTASQLEVKALLGELS